MFSLLASSVSAKPAIKTLLDPEIIDFLHKNKFLCPEPDSINKSVGCSVNLSSELQCLQCSTLSYFTTQRQLNNHLVTTHKSELLSCPSCMFPCVTQEELLNSCESQHEEQNTKQLAVKVKPLNSIKTPNNDISQTSSSLNTRQNVSSQSINPTVPSTPPTASHATSSRPKVAHKAPRSRWVGNLFVQKIKLFEKQKKLGNVRHQQLTTKSKCKPCFKCAGQFSSNNLKRHQERCTGLSGPQICPICFKRCANPRALKLHNDFKHQIEKETSIRFVFSTSFALIVTSLPLGLTHDFV